jgi:hypothetical protein
VVLILLLLALMANLSVSLFMCDVSIVHNPVLLTGGVAPSSPSAGGCSSTGASSVAAGGCCSCASSGGSAF